MNILDKKAIKRVILAALAGICGVLLLLFGIRGGCSVIIGSWNEWTSVKAHCDG